MRDPSDPSRRRFLQRLTWMAGGTVGVVVVVPALRFLSDPASRRTVDGADDFVDVCSVSALTPGGPPLRVQVVLKHQRDAWAKVEDVRAGAAWISLGGDGKPHAFSGACPHLGCAVEFNVEAARFVCPCHGSKFTPDGARISGPARRGLDPLEATVRDGRILVRFARFLPDSERRVRV